MITCEQKWHVVDQHSRVFIHATVDIYGCSNTTSRLISKNVLRFKNRLSFSLKGDLSQWELAVMCLETEALQ